MAAQDVNALSPTSLFARRRWTHALFTSYTLSLTFFETIVLRALREQGCEEVWVLADAEGYRASLMERRSMRVGLEYRLVPVALPHGVFHPKCSYLAGPDGDLLLVGSGNVTFGGFGRNVEVLEAFDSKLTPAVFRDFAGFIDALGRRSDIRIADLDWLPWFTNRARSVVVPTGRSADVRLVHCVEQTIQAQLVQAAGAPVTRLTMLSPFHDPAGTAVKNLAQAVGCSRIRIGLPPSRNELSTFPFGTAKQWPGLKVDAVRLADVTTRRPLHAKWIDLETRVQKLTLTGSINSTFKALATTDNIEVGILRSEPIGGAAAWEKADIPKSTKSLSYEASGLGNNCVVYAVLTGDGALRGQVVSTQMPAGKWTGTLRAANQRATAFAATVSAGGHFACRPQAVEQVLFQSALQIEMEREQLRARGWVHQPELLRVGGLRRLGVSALVRLINGDETEDDDIALLEYLAISAANHSLTFSRPIQVRARSQADQTQPQDREIDLDAIAPQETTPTTDTEAGNRPGLEDAIARVFVQFRKRLLGRRRNNHAGAIAGAVDGDDPDEGLDSQHVRVTHAFSSFNRHMEELTLEPALAARHARGLYVIWLEVSLQMFLGRLRDSSAAISFIKDWFRTVTDRGPAPAEITALEQYIYAIAGLLVLLPPTEDRLRLSQLHERLEKFNRGDVDYAHASACATAGSQAALLQPLIQGDASDVVSAVERILADATIRNELLSVLRAYEDGQNIGLNSPIFEGAVGEEFRRALSTHPAKPIYLPLRDTRLACAHCFSVLTPAARMSLLNRRIARCELNCGKWTVRLDA